MRATHWARRERATHPSTHPGARIEAGAAMANAEADMHSQNIADMASNRQLRQRYAGKAYGLAAGCLAMWTTLLSVQGAVKASTGIEMWSDQVLIAVTTGVTVSVLAAFLGVIRGLFPGREAGKGGPAPAPP